MGGRRLWLRRSGAGPPVLLLNGIAGSPATWQPLQRYLNGFERIELALPGRPDVADWRPVLTMAEFAALVSDALDELGIECAHVLGFSFGGMVAQQLAHDMPARVRGLILVATICGLGAIPSSPLSWWQAIQEEAQDTPPAPLGLLPHWWAWRWARTVWREFGVGWSDGVRPDELVQRMAATWLWSSLPWLPGLPQQVLVITGTADAVAPPENADILASRIPHARLHRVRGGGHFCVVDRVAEVGPVIADFLRSSQPASGDQTVELG
ncbi:MAG: alpha/beta hydrolase [Mycobacterium sp.]|uniref:alpha/beta fold hydrolase n=1 Tax=Mycobacterium sp. TaxID=1785 RepID=UPI0026029854|nr:alpha/beta hydrolase [Mycobacterium sp.]MDI3313127.1 alpha/beta hydrolase [Mycobacterium sp.]